MKAITVQSDVAGRLALADVEPPTPKAYEALVRVASISLNRGEVKQAQTAELGYRPGWDLAGVVEQAAADGSGPKVGQRVVGLVAAGAWSEVVPAPAIALAELPTEVSFAQASTLPVAGLTALYALNKGGNLSGRNVLITGATGGVGHFAVQLAALGEAKVVAMVRQQKDEALVKEAGASQVIISEDGAAAASAGPYHLIVDGIGGKVLGNLLGMLAPNGTLVSFGATLSAEVTFDANNFRRVGGATLYGLRLFHEAKPENIARDLGHLANLVATGDLRPCIGVETSWTDIGVVAQRLLNRDYVGKAVLHLAS